MALTQKINVSITRKKLFEVKMSVLDKSRGFAVLLEGLRDVNLDDPQNDQALIFEDDYWVNKFITASVDPSKFVNGEVPTPAPPVLLSEKYTTANNFATGTLEVFLNGMKLLPSDLTIYAPNQFSISTLDTIATDVVTVNYIKP